MPQYSWSRMFPNTSGFLVCPNKAKQSWISLDTAIDTAKVIDNVIDTAKVTAQVSIYKRSRILNCIKRPRWSLSENV